VVNQALFGYDDGHRLLVSSTKLSLPAISDLLPLSDLVSGFDLSRHMGYWTGLPLTELRLYALLKTWPAPEMPRPGCVWTHALFIDFDSLALIDDLGSVARLARRPSREFGTDAYSRPLKLSVHSDADFLGLETEPAHLLALVRAVYSPKPPYKVAAELGELDNAVFALWSQQWPRLRQMFTFRTSSTPLDLRMQRRRFSLLTLPVSDPIARAHVESHESVRSWENAVIQDLANPNVTQFREFLWKFGGDVRQGRLRFRNLAQWFVKTRSAQLVGQDMHSVLDDLTRVLPDLEDGQTLKLCLVSIDQRTGALIPPRDPLSIVEFYIEHTSLESLPELPNETFEAIWHHWQSRSREIFVLAESAISGSSELVERILGRLSQLIDRESALSQTVDFPSLRRELVRRNPEILDSRSVTLVPVAELITSLEVLDPTSDLFRRVVSRLLAIDDSTLSDMVLRSIPDQILAIVAHSLEAQETPNSITPADAWKTLISRESHRFIQDGFLEGTRSTRAMAQFAALLGYESEAVSRFGARPWVNALFRAKDDVAGEDRKVFLSFLLGMALRDSKRGHELLLEMSFDSVHEQLRRGALPKQAFARFESLLPNVESWQQWDTCLRLRIAVVRAFVEHDLDPFSFKRLTVNYWLQEELNMLASRSGKGRKFLKKVEAPSD
jgi:hypothetical protein